MATDKPFSGDNRAPAYDPAVTTFERIVWSGGVLAIECKACGRRGVLTKENCPHLHEGNKTQVRHAKFKCGNRQCASTEVRIYGGYLTMDEAEMFLAGDPLAPEREIPKKASWEG